MPKKDLRQMKNSKQGPKGTLNKEDIYEAAKKININADTVRPGNSDIQSVEETVARYEDKSEGELIGDLEQMISNGRKDGTFSDEMLDSFVKNVAPMMDAAQRSKLESIAKMIKTKKQ